MKFDTYFTKENFLTILNVFHTKDSDSENFQKVREVIDANFRIPLEKFLIDLRDNGVLSQIDNSVGHYTLFSTKWNKFLKNKKDKHDGSVAENFLEKVLFNYTYKEDINIDEEYNKLVENISAGNFNYYYMPEDVCQCFDCAQRFKLSFKNWKGQYLVYENQNDGDLNYGSLVKPESCIPEEIVEVEINFPTGEVLAIDWVRIKEFTKLVEPENQYHDSMSLNYLVGRINTTKHYAQKHNFVCVSVGNNSPYIFEKEGNLVVGRKDEDSEESPSDEYKELAWVITDFWGVTLIDKQQLIDILSIELKEKAKDVVEEYLLSEFSGNIFRIEPGEYVLRFAGDSYKFHDLEKEDSEIRKFFQINKKEQLIPNLGMKEPKMGMKKKF